MLRKQHKPANVLTAQVHQISQPTRIAGMEHCMNEGMFAHGCMCLMKPLRLETNTCEHLRCLERA